MSANSLENGTDAEFKWTRIKGPSNPDDESLTNKAIRSSHLVLAEMRRREQEAVRDAAAAPRNVKLTALRHYAQFQLSSCVTALASSLSPNVKPLTGIEIDSDENGERHGILCRAVEPILKPLFDVMGEDAPAPCDVVASFGVCRRPTKGAVGRHQVERTVSIIRKDGVRESSKGSSVLDFGAFVIDGNKHNNKHNNNNNSNNKNNNHNNLNDNNLNDGSTSFVRKKKSPRRRLKSPDMDDPFGLADCRRSLSRTNIGREGVMNTDFRPRPAQANVFREYAISRSLPSEVRDRTSAYLIGGSKRHGSTSRRSSDDESPSSMPSLRPISDGWSEEVVSSTRSNGRSTTNSRPPSSGPSRLSLEADLDNE